MQRAFPPCMFFHFSHCCLPVTPEETLVDILQAVTKLPIPITGLLSLEESESQSQSMNIQWSNSRNLTRKCKLCGTFAKMQNSTKVPAGAAFEPDGSTLSIQRGIIAIFTNATKALGKEA